MLADKVRYLILQCDVQSVSIMLVVPQQFSLTIGRPYTKVICMVVGTILCCYVT